MFFCAVADLTKRRFCYDKARELKFAELAVYKDSLKIWFKKDFSFLRYVDLKLMHKCRYKKHFFAQSPT
jgi:hypothetical protein